MLGEISLSKSDYERISDALKHYSKKLLELQEDEEIKDGNGILRDDVRKNSDEALKLSRRIIEFKSFQIIQDNSQIICSALTMHERDLAQSKTKLTEKLGKDIHFEWKNVDYELTQIAEVKKSIGCPNHK